MFDILALGEILLRLSPPMNEKLVRGETFEKQVGGEELNVLSGASLLGLRAGIISKIAENDIGEFARNRVRFVGVSDDYLMNDIEKDARLGIYYYENGAYPRKPRIVYDRSHTSMSKISIEDFPDTMYSLTRCFHTTGITLALGEQVRTTAYEMIKKFKKNGALISFDVNFRSNLWSGEEARRTIEEILPLVDIFFCSEETARLTFKKSGNLKDMMKEFADEYNIGVIASTQRIVHSPKIHTFGSVIYEKCSDTFYEEPPYSKIEVVDRIGSGDAYISGVLYGILSENGSCAKALSFGNAAGAIKNTIPGDMQASLRGEVEAVIQSHRLKGNDCEMVR